MSEVRESPREEIAEARDDGTNNFVRDLRATFPLRRLRRAVFPIVTSKERSSRTDWCCQTT
jgi:hypothetical protein